MDETPAIDEDDCLAVWCAGDEWCAVTCAMEVIGNKWHPVIIHRLLTHEQLRFNELSNEIGVITNKVLSNSLDDLEEKQLVERTVVNDKPVEVEYALSDRGESLRPVIEELEQWAKERLRPADSEADSVC